jgi:hypothetical protein
MYAKPNEPQSALLQIELLFNRKEYRYYRKENGRLNGLRVKTSMESKSEYSNFIW